MHVFEVRCGNRLPVQMERWPCCEATSANEDTESYFEAKATSKQKLLKTCTCEDRVWRCVIIYVYIHTYIYIYISQDSQGFPRVRYGLLGFARISQGLTRPNKVAQGLTRSHMVSQGLTRSHKVPQGPKRSHKASQGLTRSHKVSQGLTWSHKVSQERIYFRSVWLGSDWFGFAIHEDLGIQLFDN